MPLRQKKPIIDLPIKLLFTEEGVSFFLKGGRKLTKFKLADNQEYYGINLDQISPGSLQRMLQINYISNIEISRAEFMSKRAEIMDLSKLIVFSALYRIYDELVFDKVIHSNLLIQWNRMNPSNIIDEKTKLNEKYLNSVITENEKQIYEIKQEILEPIYSIIQKNRDLQPDEKNIQIFLSEKFLSNVRPFIWFILSKFRGTREYLELHTEIRNTLFSYIEKSKIAEYLSLMIMELAINAENTGMQNFANQKYKGTVDPKAVLFDPVMREKVLQEMTKQEENCSISWKTGVRSGSIGMRNKLEVTIFNKEAEFRVLKQSMDTIKDVNLKQKSLIDFYREIPDAQSNTELGLYYLSYLNAECAKVNVRFESLVNQLREKEQPIIILKLGF